LLVVDNYSFDVFGATLELCYLVSIYALEIGNTINIATQFIL